MLLMPRSAQVHDIRTLKARLEALNEFSKEEDFGQAVLTFKRAANIIRKQGDEAGQELTGSYDADLFDGEHESAFGAKLEEPHLGLRICGNGAISRDCLGCCANYVPAWMPFSTMSWLCAMTVLSG